MYTGAVSERISKHLINGLYFDEKALLKDDAFFVTISVRTDNIMEDRG